MICPECGRENRPQAAFCDGCGHPLAPGAGDDGGFVGRQDELRVLHEGLERAVQGTAGLFLVAGEPGIGKSRLARECAADAAGLGFQVLWGRCLEDSSTPPYWPWLQLIRGRLGSVDDARLADLVGDDAPLLIDLLPDLAERLGEVESAAPLGVAAQARFRLFEAIVRLWQRIASEQAALLVLENIHAADPVSLRLLEFLAAELPRAPLVILATCRDLELAPGSGVARTVAELSRVPHCHRLDLAGLTRAETDRLLCHLGKQRAPPPELAAAVHANSDGNPLFIREWAQSLEHKGLFGPDFRYGERQVHVPVPEGIREVLRQRLGRLSPGCRDLLAAAAVVGRAFELELLVGLEEGLAIEAVLERLDEAARARLVDALAQPGRYQFSHALIRETLYEELPAARRLQLHRLVGERLAALHGEPSLTHLARLADHFMRSAPLGTAARAMACALEAAERADSLLAYEEAARLYTLGLDLQARYGEADEAERCRLLLGLGAAQYKAGDFVEALATFRRAAANARARHATEDLARAALGFEDASWRPGFPGAAASRLLQESVAAAGPDDSPLKARLLGALTRALIFSGDVERATEVQASAVAIARRLGDPSVLAAVLRSGLSARWCPERLAERLDAAAEVTVLAERAGDWDMVFEGLSWQMFDLLEVADMAAVHAVLERHVRLAQELHQPFYRYIGVSFRAVLALAQGRFDSSERSTREALELGRRQGLDALGVFSLQMFTLERERGRLAALAPLLERFLAQASAGAVWRPGLALMYVELDRLDAARVEFDRLAADDFAAVARDGLWVSCLAYLAEVCAALGDEVHADALYRKLLPYAGRNVVAGTTVACYGAADRFLGMLAATAGRRDTAARHFEDAIALDGRTGFRTWLAHSRYEYAHHLLRGAVAGDRAKAASLLQGARAEAETLGMHGLLRRIESLASRGRPEAEAAANPAGLSRREREVLQLLVLGKSNRDIADRLFVSPNTVANHVRNILAKTRTRNRTEAAAYARRHGVAAERSAGESWHGDVAE